MKPRAMPWEPGFLVLVMLRNCSYHGRSSLDGDELAAVYEVEVLRSPARISWRCCGLELPKDLGRCAVTGFVDL